MATKGVKSLSRERGSHPAAERIPVTAAMFRPATLGTVIQSPPTIMATCWTHSGLCGADSIHGFTLVDGTGVNTADGHFTSVRVHPNLGDHHGKFLATVAVHHGLTDVRFQIARPDVGDTVLLSLNGTGALRPPCPATLRERVLSGRASSLVFVVAVLENFLEGNAGLGHVRHSVMPQLW